MQSLEASYHRQKCREMAELLGLDEPVSLEVLLAALEDEIYARNLLICRGEPIFLNHLLANPPRAQVPVTTLNEPSNLRLLADAGRALARWAKTGFSVVDDETLRRREDACLACPHLSEPQTVLQKLIPSKPIRQRLGERTGQRICKLCGCNAGKKMRLSSETCPAPHPTLTDLNRWEESLV